jgi:hypothetical protein
MAARRPVSVRRAAATVAVLVSALALAGCGNDGDAESQALKDDPMGSWAPDSLELVSERVSGADDDTLTGKPVRATVSRIFRITEGTPDEALAGGVAEAERAGWERQRLGRTGYTARKTITDKLGVLTLALSETDGEERLSVLMTMQ